MHLPLTHRATRPSRRALAALAFALSLAGCGGGGGSSGSGGGGGGTDSFATYQAGTLPGRLVVNTPSGLATVYDLQTGVGTALPASSIESSGSPDGDEWMGGLSSSLLRVNETQLATDASSTVRIDTMSAPALQTSASRLVIAGDLVGRAQRSPDGRYILAFFSSGIEDARLTIFDASDGHIVKQGSLLDGGDLILDTPATWLPDGRYVYLVDNELYASTPTSSTATLLAVLSDLPSNRTSDWTGYISGQSSLQASPDGNSIAFTWSEQRGVTFDKHVWVTALDGTGLHRVTSPPDATSPLTYRFTSPTWSPDSRWVAAVLDMHETGIGPTFPPSPYQDIPPPSTVTGTTGCNSSQVVVLEATAVRTTINWPTLDATHGVRARAGDGSAWITTCSGITWTS